MSKEIRESTFYVAVDIGPNPIEVLMTRYELAYDRMSENHCYDVYHTAPASPDGFTLVFKVIISPDVSPNRVRSAARLEAMKLAFKCLNPIAEDSAFIGLQPFPHPTFNRSTRQPYATGYIVPVQDLQEDILKRKAKKRDEKEYVFVEREEAAPECLDDQGNASSAPGQQGQW